MAFKEMSVVVAITHLNALLHEMYEDDVDMNWAALHSQAARILQSTY
jgi:hypothetical protein